MPVRRYLAEFLSDPRIIELPRWLWNVLLHGIILRVRPVEKREGLPRGLVGGGRLAAAEHLASARPRRSGPSSSAASATTSSSRSACATANPSIDGAIAELEAANVRRLIVLPMYPQYSGTTTASVFDAVTSRLQRTRWIPEMRFVNQFCDQRGFVEALAASVRESWAEHGRGELLVTSYHGIPKRYLTNGDPYHCLCHKTSRLLAEELGIGPLTRFASCSSRASGARSGCAPTATRP